MFNTSVVFIKAQIPGTTVNDLKQYYKRELSDHGVTNIAESDNEIHFSNGLFKLSFDRHHNQFAGFNTGQLTFSETDLEYHVRLKASIDRIFIRAAVIAIPLALLSIWASGISLYTLEILIFSFLILSFVSGVFTWVFFPVYFVSLRNRIESNLQGKE